MTGLEILGQFPRRLGNDLQAPSDRVDGPLILAKLLECQAFNEGLRQLDIAPNVLERS